LILHLDDLEDLTEKLEIGIPDDEGRFEISFNSYTWNANR